MYLLPWCNSSPVLISLYNTREGLNEFRSKILEPLADGRISIYDFSINDLQNEQQEWFSVWVVVVSASYLPPPTQAWG